MTKAVISRFRPRERAVLQNLASGRSASCSAETAGTFAQEFGGNISPGEGKELLDIGMHPRELIVRDSEIRERRMIPNTPGKLRDVVVPEVDARQRCVELRLYREDLEPEGR